MATPTTTASQLIAHRTSDTRSRTCQMHHALTIIFAKYIQYRVDPSNPSWTNVSSRITTYGTTLACIGEDRSFARRKSIQPAISPICPPRQAKTSAEQLGDWLIWLLATFGGGSHSGHIYLCPALFRTSTTLLASKHSSRRHSTPPASRSPYQSPL